MCNVYISKHKDIFLAILGLLSEADSYPNRYYRVSDKSPRVLRTLVRIDVFEA